jgi:hypothetical protein
MNNYYKEITLSNPELIKGLNKVISHINYDKVNKILYKPLCFDGLSRVSLEVLEEIKGKDRPVATYDCNVLKFNNIHFPYVSELIKKELNKKVILSGRTWYPKNGYMGWHTNSNNKGFRLYCSYVAEANKSFFRYFENGEIVTSWDKEGWNFRIFNVNHLFWHCVYSETDRFSIGYAF